MVFRNRYNVLLLACALFLALSGCRRDDVPSGPRDGYAVIVEASLPNTGSKVGVDTRTAADANVAFQAGSEVGIYVISRTALPTNGARPLNLVKPDPADVTDVDVYNSNYYANEAGVLVRVPLEFYPSFDEDKDKPRHVDIYGYHPYNATINDATEMTSYPFEVSANQGAASDYLYSDFMWAKSTDITPSAVAVPMVFEHKMSRVDVLLTLPLTSSTGKIIADVPPSNVKFFNVQRGATVNLSTGVVTTGVAADKKGDMFPNPVVKGNPGVVTPGVVTAGVVTAGFVPAVPYKYSFIAPAQTFIDGDNFFSCDITYKDGTSGNITYKTSASMFDTHALTTQAGKYHTLNLTLSGPIELVLTGSTIADWVTGVGVDANLNSKVTTVFSATLSGVTIASGGINRVKVTTDVEGAFDLSVGVTYTGEVCEFKFGGGRSPNDYGFRITKLDFYNDDISVASSDFFTSARVYNPTSMNLGTVAVLAPPALLITDGVWDTESNVYWATGNLVANGANGCQIGAPTDYGLYFQFGSLIGWSETDPLTIAVKPSNYLIDPDPSWTDCPKYDGTGLIPTPQDQVNRGIGDACTYYLKGKWRLPTTLEYKSLFGSVADGTAWGSVPNWSWSDSYANYTNDKIRFPASGRRNLSDGSFSLVGSRGYCWSSSVSSSSNGYSLNFNPSSVYPQGSYNRSYGWPVRCVRDR